MPFGGGFHELIGHAYRLVHVLESYRAVGRTVKRAVVAFFDERPCLARFFLLGDDELLDVRVPHLKRLQNCSAPRFAAALDRTAGSILHPREGNRPRRLAASRKALLRRAKRRPVGTNARAELEETCALTHQAPDVVDGVFARDDEARRGLRLLVRIDGDHFLLFGVPRPDLLIARVADAVLMVQTYVEPYRAVKRPVLVHAEPCQVVVEPFAVFFGGKIILLDAPVGNRSGDSVD